MKVQTTVVMPVRSSRVFADAQVHEVLEKLKSDA